MSGIYNIVVVVICVHLIIEIQIIKGWWVRICWLCGQLAKLNCTWMLMRMSIIICECECESTF